MGTTYNIITPSNSLVRFDSSGAELSPTGYSHSWTISGATMTVVAEKFVYPLQYSLKVQPTTEISTVVLTLTGMTSDDITLYDDDIQFHARYFSGQSITISTSLLNVQTNTTTVHVDTTTPSEWSTGYSAVSNAGGVALSFNVVITISGHAGNEFYLSLPILISDSSFYRNAFVRNLRKNIPSFIWDKDGLEEYPTYPFYKLFHVLTSRANDAAQLYSDMYGFNAEEIPPGSTADDGWTKSNLVHPEAVSPEYLSWLGQFTGSNILRGVNALSTEAVAGTGAITWTTQTPNFAVSRIQSVAYGNSLWVIAGYGGAIRTSTDAITWTTQTSNFATNYQGAIFSVAYGNSLWVAGGYSGQLRTSTDAVTWTTRTSNFGNYNIKSIAYNNNLWVAGSQVGQIRTSTDAITWTTRTSNFGTTTIASVAYGNALWVAGGYYGQLRTSTDAVTWTTRTSNFENNYGGIRSVAYGNALWVAGGYVGQIRTSTDAITWTTQTSNFGTTTIYSIAYGNSLWIASGFTGQLRTSTDAITWTTRTSNFGTSRIHSTAYGNNLWVAGGYSGQLRTSTVDTITTQSGSEILSANSIDADDFVLWQLENSYFGWASATTSAIRESVQQILTGAKVCYVFPTGPSFIINIYTVLSETPDAASNGATSASVLAIANLTKPLGFTVSHAAYTTLPMILDDAVYGLLDVAPLG